MQCQKKQRRKRGKKYMHIKQKASVHAAVSTQKRSAASDTLIARRRVFLQGIFSEVEPLGGQTS